MSTSNVSRRFDRERWVPFTENTPQAAYDPGELEEQVLKHPGRISLMRSGSTFAFYYSNSRRDKSREFGLTRVSDLDVGHYAKGAQRAGIIPYWRDEEGNLMLLFGCDSRSGDLCDFGGSCEMTKDATLVDTAFREYQEEAYGVFDIKFSSLSDSMAIIDDESSTMEIFCKIEKDPCELFLDFEDARKRDNNAEILGLCVLTIQQLESLLASPETGVYVRIRRFLEKNLSRIKTLP